ncbi:MAG: hypothetical protein IJ719_11500 [Clostridia bacterium]|nr:hypothetical protein [Clostridia bacterium]
MKRISLEQVLEPLGSLSYPDQVKHILMCIERGELAPVRRSPKNGKRPALHTQYWLLESEPDRSQLKEDLLYHLNSGISIEYYLRHLDVYENEQADVHRLSHFLDRTSVQAASMTVNERAFDIWGREKYLTAGPGRTILRHCGMEIGDLGCYPTAEPFAAFVHSRETPQNLLILENKDPFISMRGHLLGGHSTVLGTEIGTLIYGGGKRVVSSFQDFSLSAEPYMQVPENRLYYFGDLDYEGILIYESLIAHFEHPGLTIVPFLPGYQAMLSKAESAISLPTPLEGQNRDCGDLFFRHFSQEVQAKMRTLLDSNRYIPQEILNANDY